MDENRSCWGLLRRRQCLVPTWRGWLALILFACGLLFCFVRTVEPFLAVSDPLPGGAMVIEGWASDDAFDASIAEFNRNHYQRIFVTGGPITHGEPFSEFKTQAEFGAAILLKKGLSPDLVQAIPSPRVVKDRTFTEAKTLKRWLGEHGHTVTQINLITEGPHARRSRLLFEKGLGPEIKVGVMAMPSTEYDQDHWWRSSAGVRTMIGELLAYAYARLLFCPPKE